MWKPTRTGATVSVHIDGAPCRVPAGSSVASVLLQQRKVIWREGRARTPLCLMGVCYECLVWIDGEQQQGCQVPVAEGMEIETGGEHAG
ncbi:(2Fe-2S)-binding protein [Oceanimonas marisflavi]|uniref:(2Fe-2S)-binding protein n=1 Tax=Oceanimonas marisflavi TaxID=2059724 RepID=UPI000D314321|nr:(2Fe-2S)-binding protein [Oceanimonas marisflavi]